MKGFYPFYEDHLAVIILAIPQLGTNGVNQLIEVKQQAFVKRPKYHILEQIINFLRVLLDIVGHGGFNETNDPIEDIEEVLGAKDGLLAGLYYVEHAVAGRQLHLLILVIETSDNGCQQFIQESSLFLLVQCHCYN